jgi:molecular chaperone DnaK
MAAFNKTLGKFQLVGIPPAPRGMPQVEVTFDIDANGIIHVSAKDLGTGNEQQIRIEGGSGLSEDEVRRMVAEAESHAEEAHTMREVADARNGAETLVYSTEKTLGEHRDKLEAEQAAAIETALEELKKAAEGADAAAIRSKTEALATAAQPLAQAIYAEAQAAASQAPPSGDGEAGHGDEVVEDADYEVIDEDETART